MLSVKGDTKGPAACHADYVVNIDINSLGLIYCPVEPSVKDLIFEPGVPELERFVCILKAFDLRGDIFPDRCRFFIHAVVDQKIYV